MMYIVLDKARAVELGFSLHTHIEAHGKMILNEKELLGNDNIKGESLQEKAESIGGGIMTEAQLEQFKREGGN